MRQQQSAIECQVAVVGAGPAGLGAMVALQAAGIDALIVEAGPDLGERDSDVPEHYAEGIGGAGLFSDGKFSFHPSATALWRCEPRSELRHAYNCIAGLLAEHGMTPPPFPSVDPQRAEEEEGHFHAKRYPSAYLSLEARYRLNHGLAEAVEGRRVRGTATRIDYDGKSSPQITVRTLDRSSTVRARSVIYAGGRLLGPLSGRLGDRVSPGRDRVPHRAAVRRTPFCASAARVGTADWSG